MYQHIIKPVCEKCGFIVQRVDEFNTSNSITQEILDVLNDYELVIADLTGHNPNVFFEIGYRIKSQRPIIHLKCKDETIPFDVSAIRTFEYDLTDLDSVEEVKNRLTKTIESFNYSENTETSVAEETTESASPAIMPVLYQILDSISDVKNEIKSINTETIGTVIKSMQNTQPQMSQDTALQMQLISGLMQNPDSFMKLIEFSEKLPKGRK